MLSPWSRWVVLGPLCGFSFFAASAFPLHFEPNRGQAPTEALYLARTTLFSRQGPIFTQGAARLRMTLDGAAHSLPIAESPLSGRTNYLPNLLGIPNFAALRYSGVYRGIDLVFHGAPQGLEYDFTVAPGADPRAVRMRFDGRCRIEEGELIVAGRGMELRHHAPIAYQEIDGARRAIPAAFHLGEGSVAFDLGPYDRARPLVIDPVLLYATYFGGAGAENASAVLLDGAGNTVLAGNTSGTAYVAKLDPKSNVIFTTHLPAADTTVAGAVLDAGNNIVVTGYGTASAPGFVIKLSAAGDKVFFTSAFNGFGAAIAQDVSGNLYVTGNTFGSLQTTAGVVQAAPGGGQCSDTPTGGGVCSDAFVLKLSGDGSKVLYATYLGGKLEDTGRAIAVDTAGNAYITGDTVSPDFPLLNPAQTKFVPLQQSFGSLAAGHAFVAKLSPDASKLIYSTYLGGSAADVGYGIALDALGDAVVAGSTTSTDFPATRDAFQPSGADTTTGDAFVVKYSPAGTVLWSTLLGGSQTDSAAAVALDPQGNVYLAGNTNSTDFPITTDSIPSCRRNTGPFVSQLDAAGQHLLRSTKTSGIGYDIATAMALDPANGIVYLAGGAASEVFLASGTASQATYAGGNSDAFVAKLDWNHAPGAYVACVLNAASFQAGNLTPFPLGSVAPGEIVSIFGVGLGPSPAVSSPVLTSTGAVATAAGGTQVFFDGVPAPLLYVGLNQINAVVPYEVSATTQMTIKTLAGTFGPVIMPVAAAVPSVFTADGSGTGLAAALNQDGSYNTVANPAIRGQIVTFFLTGAGLMSPNVADGFVSAISSAQPVAQLPVSVTIRGVDAQVLFAGSAPGYVSGLMQLNVVVPGSINFGNNVPLLVNFGAYSSQLQVSLAVK